MTEKKLDSENVDIVGAEREFSVADVNGKGLDAPEIDTSKVLPSTFEMEKFLQDDLQVEFHPAANEYEPQFVELDVNGRRAVIKRGERATLKRFQVAVLAQSKIGRIQQDKIIGQNGAPQYVEREVFSMSYPFSVVYDPSPRGPAWLKQQLANPL